MRYSKMQALEAGSQHMSQQFIASLHSLAHAKEAAALGNGTGSLFYSDTVVGPAQARHGDLGSKPRDELRST